MEIDLKRYTTKNGKTIVLDYLNLRQLPQLPIDITGLCCYGNKLTKLPELPKSLELLDCENNNLTKLPELPESLKSLNCSDNNLIELPELPESLKILICRGNNLPYYDLNSYWKWFWKENPDLWAAKQMGLY